MPFSPKNARFTTFCIAMVLLSIAGRQFNFHVPGTRATNLKLPPIPRTPLSMRSPPGAQRAPEPLTRKRLRDPSVFMIQSADSRLSLTLSTQPRV